MGIYTRTVRTYDYDGRMYGTGVYLGDKSDIKDIGDATDK